MRIALAQVASGTDKTANLTAVADFVEQAAGQDAQLVVFPEYTTFNKPPVDVSYVQAAEPLDGSFCTQIRELAARFGIIVALGVLETTEVADHAYNTIVVVGPDGGDLCTYRKEHLYDAFGGRESDFLLPGSNGGPVTFTVDGVRVGIMTCYDLRFPEMGRVIADAGAEVALIPSSWTPGPRKEDHWLTLTRARAIENVFYVAAVGQAPPFSTGGSLLIDPMGAVLADGGDEPNLIVRDIDVCRVATTRERVPVLENRRYRVVSRN